jgi:ABC-type antimicrobial peptide transport system permease subunit
VALGAAAALLLACAAVALLVPVRRATRVDPISALR